MSARVLLIDNYDSFTYNLAHGLAEQGAHVDVFRHDEVTADAAAALQPTHLVISPGPGRPSETGISAELIRRLHGRAPILGVCLGHQLLAEMHGGTVTHARRLVHGKAGTVEVVGDDPLFAGLGERFEAGRYHSLAAIQPLPDGVPPDGPRRRRRGDGDAAPRRAHPRRPVPPRVDPDAPRPSALAKLPGADRMREYLEQLVAREDLGFDRAHAAMGVIMRGDANPSEVAGFLVALRTKGETPQEIAGCVASLREHVVPVSPQRRDLTDVVGTGGDGANTFNISTAAGIVVAACGHGVAKHGNRALSSLAGSADVLEALGVAIDLPRGRRRDADRRGRIRLHVRARTTTRRCVSPARSGASSGSGP